MPPRKRKSAASPYRDERTARRYRLMMWARFPGALMAAGAVYLVGDFWPAMVALGLWYLVWLVWVAGVFDHH